MNPQDPFNPQTPTLPSAPPATLPMTPPQVPLTVSTQPEVLGPKKRQIVWIVVIAVVLLLVTGTVIYFLQASKTSPSNAASPLASTHTAADTDTSSDLFGNMDQVSDGTTTASTDCYSLTIPDGFTAGAADNTTCTITLTENTESTTIIKISAFSSAYCEQMDDIIDCINDRYEETATSANRTFYGASHISINTYRTGLAYIADTAGLKRAHYSIEHTAHTSKASGMSSITAFLITGPADTDNHDADTRLVAKSFIIK